MTALPVRATARLLVFDPAERLLLIRYTASRDVDPARPGLRGFWFTPGGGIEPGETPEQAGQRELVEETGILAPIGPLIARRRGPLTLFRRPVTADEHYFLVHAPTDRLDTGLLHATEGDPVEDVRWWPLAELAATGDVIEPVSIIALAGDCATGIVPAAPRWLT